MKRFIILAILFAMLIGTGIAENIKTGDVKAFQKALEKDGFTVQQGGIGYFDAIRAYNLGVLTSALGNNPTTKYLTCFVPPAPGHKVPKSFAEIAKALGIVRWEGVNYMLEI